MFPKPKTRGSSRIGVRPSKYLYYYYNNERYHESLNKVTPADAYFIGKNGLKIGGNN